MALLRVPAAGALGPGHALARGARERLPRGPGPAPGRGPAERNPARRGAWRGGVVGLVGDEDRRRVAARHRTGHLRPADRLAPGVRPARTGAPSGAARRIVHRETARGPPRR